jgi:hypothetical protein
MQKMLDCVVGTHCLSQGNFCLSVSTKLEESIALAATCSLIILQYEVGHLRLYVTRPVPHITAPKWSPSSCLQPRRAKCYSAHGHGSEVTPPCGQPTPWILEIAESEASADLGFRVFGPRRPLAEVTGSVNAHRLNRQWGAHLRLQQATEDEELRKSNEAAVAEGREPRMFFRSMHLPEKGMFCRIPSDLCLGSLLQVCFCPV